MTARCCHHLNATLPNYRHRVLKRRLLVGLTAGGRALTLVIERTIDPTTWLIITGRNSTDTERKLL